MTQSHTINLGAQCSGEQLIGRVARQAIDGLIHALAPTQPEDACVLDLGCGTGWVLKALIEQLPSSRLGADWHNKISLHGFDNDPEAVARLRTEVGGTAHIECVDLTMSLPIAGGTAIFAFLCQVESVLSPADFRKIIETTKPKLAVGAYVAHIGLHPAQVARIARANGVTLGSTDSRLAELNGESKWIHGNSVLPGIFKDNNLLLAAQLTYVTDFPRIQYNLLMNAGP